MHDAQKEFDCNAALLVSWYNPIRIKIMRNMNIARRIFYMLMDRFGGSETC